MNTKLDILKKFYICLFLVYWTLPANAQLSPGELYKGHSHLEGIFNCTQCHTIGEKVSDDKCLHCHTEIKQRIDQKKGYHYSSEVRTKSCFQCHSDHHGKNFQIIRFDEKNFDHRKTGYPLTGKHRSIDCRACHQKPNIQEPSLLSKNFTFLGLSTACVNCHEDVHQGSLSSQCAKCHNTSSFSPASLFDHQKTKFPLLGKHRQVDCKACHVNPKNMDDRKLSFTVTSFQSCNSCHSNPHAKSVSSCQQCHTEESFTKFTGQKFFNHQQTSFELKGKHKTISCGACHNLQDQLSSLFQEFALKKSLSCMECHQDIHQGKFGNDCKKCHTEEGFTQIRNMDQFDHRLTAFPLEGKHIEVDCKQCHKTKLTDPLPHQNCSSCHTDHHERVYKRPGTTTDCKDCHTSYTFASSLFEIEDHEYTDFPLKGAHQATPCLSCHLKDNQWVFKSIGTHCIDCHKDPHDGLLPIKFYPDKKCDQCHRTEDWTGIKFDHNQTRFALEGKHATIACGKCHRISNALIRQTQIIFVNLSVDCFGCHDDVHSGQFNNPQGFTYCNNCHAFTNWSPSLFNHDNTAFKLEGRHREIACTACHKEYVDADKKYIKYQLDKYQCKDCHL